MEAPISIDLDAGRECLTTPRLLLRPLRLQDRAAVIDMHAHPDVWRVYSDDQQQATASALRLLKGAAALDPSTGQTPWAVELAPDYAYSLDVPVGSVIGIVGLLPTSFDPPFAHLADPCVEIGWRLTRAWWGHGIVTEAGLAVLAHARNQLELAEVVSFTSDGNTRSRAVMERLGLVRDPSADFDHPGLDLHDPRRRHVLYRTEWPS